MVTVMVVNICRTTSSSDTLHAEDAAARRVKQRLQADEISRARLSLLSHSAKYRRRRCNYHISACLNVGQATQQRHARRAGPRGQVHLHTPPITRRSFSRRRILTIARMFLPTMSASQMPLTVSHNTGSWRV